MFHRFIKPAYVDSQTDIINEYVKQQFATVEAFLSSNEIRALIEDENPETVAAAQTYIENLSATIPNLDSMMFSNYDCRCLVHSMKEMVGYVSADETKKTIQTTYFNDKGIPSNDVMALLSPATQSLSVIFSRTVYREDGTPGGYAALTLNTDRLNEI